MKAKPTITRLLTALLTLCMALSSVPMSAFAAELGAPPATADASEENSDGAAVETAQASENAGDSTAGDPSEGAPQASGQAAAAEEPATPNENGAAAEEPATPNENAAAADGGVSDAPAGKQDTAVAESTPSEQPAAAEQGEPSGQQDAAEPAATQSTPENASPEQHTVTDAAEQSGSIEVKTTVRNNYTDTRTNVDINYVDGIARVDGNRSGLDGSVLSFIGLGDLTVHATYDSSINKTTLILDTYRIHPQAEERTYYTAYTENKSLMKTTYDGSKLSYSDTVTSPGGAVSPQPTTGSGKVIINEIRDDYYTRNHVYERACLTIPADEDAPTVKVIDVVEVNGVTVSFKDGDKPVFTGSTPEGANYAFRCEWWELDSTTGLVSTEPEWGGDIYKNKITSFKAGKTYRYGVFVSAYGDVGNTRYVFGPNTKLKINGKFVNYKRYEGDTPDFVDGTTLSMWVLTDLTMTPEAGGTVPAEKYTVTYTDGVDGEEVFKDQTYAVESGAAMPAFSGTPARDGYEFAGWSPAVADTVTGDVTYKAMWKADPEPTVPTGTTTATNDDKSSDRKSSTDETALPKTGDDGNLRIAMLLACGFAAIGTAVACRRKRYCK